MRLLLVIPTLCALFITLLVTVLRPAGVNDFSRGLMAGISAGLSICSIAALYRRAHR